MTKNLEIRKKSEEIISLYQDKLMSAEEIGKMFGCSNAPIYKILKENSINTSKIGKKRSDMIGNKFGKGGIPPNKKILDEKEIIRLYFEENKSAPQIAKMFGCGHKVVCRILKENKINLRGFVNHTKEDKIKMSAIKQGIPLEQWKGKITPLNEQIRHSFEYRNWIKAVFQNNNFTCLGCGKRGGNLEAHHIIAFRKIMLENNIKSFEDALRCKVLWNIQNGMTLCERCHTLIDNYRKGKKDIILNLNKEI